jgi:hypothetical protein
MFILKIESEGNVFLKTWNEIQIIHENGENYVDECNALKQGYLDSGVVRFEHFDEDPRAVDNDAQQALVEHRLHSLMPYAILNGLSEKGESQSFYLHGEDRCYVMNETGKTVQCIKPSQSYSERFIADIEVLDRAIEKIKDK